MFDVLKYKSKTLNANEMMVGLLRNKFDKIADANPDDRELLHKYFSVNMAYSFDDLLLPPRDMDPKTTCMIVMDRFFYASNRRTGVVETFACGTLEKICEISSDL